MFLNINLTLFGFFMLQIDKKYDIVQMKLVAF